MAEAKKVVELKQQAYEVGTQTPDITPEMVAEVEKIKGRWLRAQTGTQEVTRDNIKHYANYMGSTNPLFFDQEYARNTRWGGIIAPGSILLGPSAFIGPGLRGVQWIFGGTDWTFKRVIRPGDIIRTKGRLREQHEKRGGAVPYWILQISEMIFSDLEDEEVARCQIYMARTPRARAAGGGMSYTPRLPRWTDEQVAEIEAEMAREEVRGATPRYWEDTEVGEPMSPVVYGPLRTEEIALTGHGGFTFIGAEALRSGAFVYELLNKRRHPAETYTDPDTGLQDHPHRGHWEEYMAREVGMPGIYDVGPHRLAWHYRFVSDWIGDDAFLKRLQGFVRKPNVIGDVTRFRGVVDKKYVADGEHIVELEIKAVNQIGEVTVPGRAWVVLPSRR